MKRQLPEAQYIDQPETLDLLMAALAEEPLLAVDTESNSLYAYREQVCLIQLSTRSADYIVDPMRVDVGPLGDLLANPAIEKVFHAAEYDIMCLKRDYGFTFANLFDTMLAARICGYQHIGLGNLLQQHLDVAVDKRHQRDNWGQRPLPEESLRYAQKDTHYLPQLRDLLADELAELDRLTEAHEVFAEACLVEPVDISFDPEGYWRLALPNQLTRRQAAILRELYLLRESLAEERDLPPFKIYSDKSMIALAQVAPHRLSDLFAVNGLSPAQVRRYGKQLIDAVRAGEHAKLPKPPPRQPPAAPETVELYTALREWRKKRARERGVESDVIISKDTLWELSQLMPESVEAMRNIAGLGPWRLATYGAEVLGVIQQYRK